MRVFESRIRHEGDFREWSDIEPDIVVAESVVRALDDARSKLWHIPWRELFFISVQLHATATNDITEVNGSDLWTNRCMYE